MTFREIRRLKFYYDHYCHFGSNPTEITPYFLLGRDVVRNPRKAVGPVAEGLNQSQQRINTINQPT